LRISASEIFDRTREIISAATNKEKVSERENVK
jgi:hypothetical protein